MSLIAEIRAQMARESGPVHPKHIAEVLEQDLATVRNTMNQANTKGNGIERLEDGTFSLIPNWVPTRGPNAAAEPASTPPQSPTPKNLSKGKKAVKPAPAKKTRKAKVASEKAEKPKRAYTRRAAPVAKRPTPGRPAIAVARGDEGSARVSRSSLRTLVSAVLAGEQEITTELRAALREATRQTAAT